MQARTWGGVLEGHTIDLADWREALIPPFDPWIELWVIGDSERHVLRSKGFEDVLDSQDAHARATILVAKLNGAFAIRTRAEPVILQGVADKSPDGTIRQHVVVALGGAQARGRAGAISSGNAAPPAPSTIQTWLALADRDDLVDDLLVHQSKAANWYDLYKVFEDVKKLCDTGEPLKQRSWCPIDAQITAFRHTANFYRHSLAEPSQRNPPKKAMLLSEASEMIRLMATGVLMDLSASGL